MIEFLLLKTCDESFALFQQFFRQHASQRIEKLFVLGDFFLPLLVVNAEQFGNAFVINIQFGHIEVVRTGQPADGRFQRTAAFFATIDDPLQHAHIFTKPGPQKFSVRPLAKPVHAKNARWISQPLSNVEPVLEIIADVYPQPR